TLRIDPDHTVDRRKPESAVSAFDRGRQGSKLLRDARQSVTVIESLLADFILRVGQRPGHFAGRDSRDAKAAAHPRFAVGSFHDAGDAAQAPVSRDDGAKPRPIEHGEAFGSADPYVIATPED